MTRPPPHPVSRRGRTNRPTVTLCYRLGCEDSPAWTVQPEGKGSIRVCDAHLALGLRSAGLPARVDPYVDEPTGRHEIPR